MSGFRRLRNEIPMDTLDRSKSSDRLEPSSDRSQALPEDARSSLWARLLSRMTSVIAQILNRGQGASQGRDAASERSTSKTFYHRDFLKRSFEGKRDDRFLNPKDGRPSELRVQCNKEVLRSDSDATWIRTRVENSSPRLFRLAYWAAGNLAIVKWLPACMVLAIVLLNPSSVTINPQNNDFFEPFLYKDWQYSDDARNAFENPPAHDEIPRSSDVKPISYRPSRGKIERKIEPDVLYLADGMEKIEVSQWRKKYGIEAKLRYIFVSYTGQQFRTEADKNYLHQVGQHAAQYARVEAYWLSCSCLGTSAVARSENVWRICDIVRGSFAVVVAVARQSSQQQELLLTEWGERVWTLPELLLSPGSDQIPIYIKSSALDSDGDNIEPDNFITLREFARFWDDKVLVGHLIDHYEGSVILSPLELTTTALRCLQSRKTIEYLEGDKSYSLMGLLRQRPNVRHDDSAFQAFARLSLANDSNLLLERLICLLPENPTDPWDSLHDHWGASLWDIYPKTQICGIGKKDKMKDTIILDGARAANIRWKSFPRVVLRKHDTIKRKLARLALTLYGLVLFIGFVIFIPAPFVPNPLKDSLYLIGGVFLGLALSIVLISPSLINWLYLGKVWSAQPWFIGVEGYMSLPDLERHLFGANLNRLSWSTAGSSLSRHSFLKSERYENYYEGQDPSSDPDIERRINAALRNPADEEKIFTLVDTYTMTVTLFAAMKPPVAVIACGEEGGMQRVLLCSWDWTNNTLYRETVLRMETRAYWKMSPVGRIRLGLQTGSNQEDVNRGKKHGDWMV